MLQLQRKNCWYLALILFAAIFSGLASGIRINEVELNPEGDDSGNEWIELYSDTEINLTGWKIKNNDNKTINLNNNFNGYLIINLSSQWLDNSDEKIYLYNNESLIDETSLISDSANDNKTWQYCGESWEFINPSKGAGNICTENQPLQNQSQENQMKAGIFLKLEYEKDVTNGEEFKVKIKAFNLESKSYDIKLYISDKEEIISEIYDEKNEEWKSGNFYFENATSGPGNKSESINLRIREKNREFSGYASITAKIRAYGKENIIFEIYDSIGIDKKISEENTENSSEKEQTETKNSIETRKVIKLNKAKDINTETKTYKSKAQYLREYAIYGFSLFCVLIIVALIIKNKKM